ncbi:MAG: tetratricopeptide repeat protein [Pararhodobacter sp.]|nr:tetratricopeptide repeat protein [Pararhodobacter sp.]
MSNPESFIDEVNEELKRERLFTLMKRYGWIAVLAVLLLVGGAAWNEWNKARQTAQAQAFGDAVFAALNETDATARDGALRALAEAESDAGREGRGRAGIVRLLMAAERLQADDRAGALAALQAVAEDDTLPGSYRQLADLKRVIIAGAEMTIDERQALLDPLARAGQAFRPLALEQLALLQLEAGNTDEALARFTALLDEPDISPGLRQRVAQLIDILGGNAAADFG